FGQNLDARASRSVFRQVRACEAPAFLGYAARLLWLRTVRRCLPFGPKISGFAGIVAREGILAYHARAVTAAARQRTRFEERYGSKLSRFRLEALVREPREVERLFDAAGLDPSPAMLDRITSQLDPRLTEGSAPADDVEQEIARALTAASYPDEA
ncbi:MAG: hypothetical protein ACRDTT_24855, partial [Pseudonocardiaceae bacterium]